MKKDFSTIKNIILLIASALTLVAVTFAWYSVSNKGGVSVFKNNINSSTLSASYYESTDGKKYTLLPGDINMTNMYEGKTNYYRIDVKTFKDVPIKLVMNFDGLTSSGNQLLPYVYFSYKIVCNDTGDELASQSGLKMSEYTSKNVFTQDISSLQISGKNDYSIYYDVYVVLDGATVSGTASLGNVKIQGQQLS